MHLKFQTLGVVWRQREGTQSQEMVFRAKVTDKVSRQGIKARSRHLWVGAKQKGLTQSPKVGNLHLVNETKRKSFF